MPKFLKDNTIVLLEGEMFHYIYIFAIIQPENQRRHSIDTEGTN